jgi:hypothetical protein
MATLLWHGRQRAQPGGVCRLQVGPLFVCGSSTLVPVALGGGQYCITLAA